ncbi:YcjX family protein [Paroceanicella profunda]|uniref:YcjX family protein n=1 Tax=Paroceanicella profunda TaxID=2579971 RepID=A0A5B8FH56_9RHOB|nr:YcjX family protein [Paroceanicella profunda]QDL91797.1 YcjX family protein [Paroceanicella profunda]
MGLSDIADGVTRLVEDASQSVGSMFEPVVRVGVTGLSRAGKTVFITSLVANLLDRGRMPQLAAGGRIETAFLQPQPDDSVPRFDLEGHLAALSGARPHWPASTRAISQLRVSLRVRPGGWLSGLSGPRTVHLDIVDYPGEWLLDLPLMTRSFAEWSADALAAARAPARAALAEGWLARLEASDPSAPLEEVSAQSLAKSFRDYLQAGRDAGLSDLAPGRFLMPGDLEGSPALTFCPLPEAKGARTGSLWRAFERRFEAYKRVVVKPFYRDHFSRIDRQVVLLDVLEALHDGPRAIEDLRLAMSEILRSFRPGPNSWLSGLLGLRRVERILFCATKADHLHHSQHPRLVSITEALLRDARDRADFRGARTAAMAIASLRATVEQTVTHEGLPLDCVRGILEESGREVVLHPGDLPEDPGAVLAPARDGAPLWLDGDYQVMHFAPPRLTRRPGEGPPHIRLDRALDFLIGDRLE